MKNQAIQYLALDVHQATMVATVRKETGAICMRATVPTEASAILVWCGASAGKCIRPLRCPRCCLPCASRRRLRI